MLKVIPMSFLEEFGLDLNSETVLDEMNNGIDIDMIISAHEEMTEELESELNKTGATLGDSDFLRVMIVVAMLNVLDYRIIDGVLVDENLQDLPLGDELISKVRDRINKIKDERGDNWFIKGIGSDLNNNFRPEGIPTYSDGSFSYSGDFMSEIANIFDHYGNGNNWENVAGVGFENGYFLLKVGEEITKGGVAYTSVAGIAGILFWDTISTTVGNLIDNGEFSTEGSWTNRIGSTDIMVNTIGASMAYLISVDPDPYAGIATEVLEQQLLFMISMIEEREKNTDDNTSSKDNNTTDAYKKQKEGIENELKKRTGSYTGGTSNDEGNTDTNEDSTNVTSGMSNPNSNSNEDTPTPSDSTSDNDDEETETASTSDDDEETQTSDSTPDDETKPNDEAEANECTGENCKDET